MATTVADAYLATDLAVANVKARFSPGTNLTDESLTNQYHAVRLSNLHPDERFTYLSGIGLTTEELDTVEKLVEDWLSAHRRKSLEEASLEACQAEKGLDSIMETWTQTRPYEELTRLINQRHISQPEAVLCYAVCAATELAWSMLIVHEFDSDRKPVTGGPDATWAEEDQRIAELDLWEDVSRWPK